MGSDRIPPVTTAPPKAVGAVAPAGWHNRVLNVFGVLLLILMGLIGVQVLASALGINPLVSFDGPVLLLGQSLNQNTLADLQWFTLSMIALMPASLVWLLDRHVRVDFLWQGFSSRTRLAIEFAGHLIFTLPFLFMSLPASWRFMMRAFNSGEMTSHGGMTHIFVVKAMLPLGLGLLALVLVIDFIRLIRASLALARSSSEGQA